MRMAAWKKISVGRWLVFWITCLAGCTAFRQSNAETPERIISWPSPAKNPNHEGVSGDFVWAASREPFVFQVWQWSDNTIVKRHEVSFSEKTYSALILPGDRWLSSVREGYCVGDLKTGKIIDRWPYPDRLDICSCHASQNGKHFALSAHESESWDYSSYHIGLIYPDDKSFQWIADLTPEYGDRSYSTMISAIPSDDGKYIGVVGWNGGFAMIDVSNKKVLWTASPNHEPAVWNANNKNKVSWKQVPLDVVAVSDLAFSPDAKMAYVGGAIGSDTVGAAGCIWGIKVETGEIVNKWGTATPKREEYCRYITSISVSPDGCFVAAGVTPTGLVFLYSTKDGKRRILKHGDSGRIDFVSFSPDSKRLATYAGYPPPSEIKIWKLPEEKEDSERKNPN